MLYHSQKGIPQSVIARLPKAKIPLRYTRHAEEARLSDRYGVVPRATSIDPTNAKIIEVETEGRGTNPVKVVYRVPVTDNLDACFAVLVEIGLVKTVWLNRANDTHKTLDLSKYD